MRNASGHKRIKISLLFLRRSVLRSFAREGPRVRMKSEDGRYTTVPVHSGEEVPKGLLRKIIREDLEMALEDFSGAYEKYKGH